MTGLSFYIAARDFVARPDDHDSSGQLSIELAAK